jgi:hypothetical protein
MTVKQRRQRTAIVGIEAFPQAIPFNGALDQNWRPRDAAAKLW